MARRGRPRPASLGRGFPISKGGFSKAKFPHRQQEIPIQIEPSKVPVTFQAIVAIRVRSPQILAAVEALHQLLRGDSDGSPLPFRIRHQPLDSLHITLARVTLTVEELDG